MREAVYDAKLRQYSSRFKPGMNRKSVELQLRKEGLEFLQIGWLEEQPKDRTAFADLIKIGEEEVPRFCSQNHVYVAFQFTATEPHKPAEAYDSDVLTNVRIFRRLLGCL